MNHLTLNIEHRKNMQERASAEKTFKINKAEIFCPKFICDIGTFFFVRHFHHNRKFIQTNVWDCSLYCNIYEVKCGGMLKYNVEELSKLSPYDGRKIYINDYHTHHSRIVARTQNIQQ